MSTPITPSVMEARLLCLEKRDNSTMVSDGRSWLITNGTGVAISQAHILTAPTPLCTATGDSLRLIEFLTTAMAESVFAVAEPGWSEWFVEKSFKMEPSY